MVDQITQPLHQSINRSIDPPMNQPFYSLKSINQSTSQQTNQQNKPTKQTNQQNKPTNCLAPRLHSPNAAAGPRAALGMTWEGVPSIRLLLEEDRPATLDPSEAASATRTYGRTATLLKHPAQVTDTRDFTSCLRVYLYIHIFHRT